MADRKCTHSLSNHVTLSPQTTDIWHSGDDVFLNEPTPVAASSQLSPVAESFTPGGYTITPSLDPRAAAHAAMAAGGFMDHGVWVPVPIGDDVPIPVSTLLSGSVPEHMNTHSGQLPRDLHSQAAQELQSLVITEGRFSSDEQLGRAILISGIPTTFSKLVLRTIFSVCRLLLFVFSSLTLAQQQNFNSITPISFKDLEQDGVIVVGFSSIRDTVRVESHLLRSQLNGNGRRLTPAQFAQHVQAQSSNPVSNHEAEVIVTVCYLSNPNPIAVFDAVSALKAFLATFGNIHALHSLPARHPSLRDFRVEFEDTRSVENALLAFDTDNIEVSGIGVASASDTDNPQLFIVNIEAYRPDVRLPSRVPREVLSVTGRSRVPASELDFLTDRQIAALNDLSLYDSGSRRNRDRYDANGNHNQVIIPKIEVGLDVRTTVSPYCPTASLLLTRHRSCFAISPTRSIRACSRRSSMRQAMALMTSCISALVMNVSVTKLHLLTWMKTSPTIAMSAMPSSTLSM